MAYVFHIYSSCGGIGGGAGIERGEIKSIVDKLLI